MTMDSAAAGTHSPKSILRDDCDLTETPKGMTSRDRSPLHATRHSGFLQANSRAYDWLVGDIRSMAGQMSEENLLRAIWKAEYFATQFHPGRFADGAIENLAFGIGATLDKYGPPPSGCPLPAVRQTGRRRVLHVALSLALGGHTPLMRHWVRNDEASCHSVLLLNERSEVPSAWKETIRAGGGELIVLPPEADFLHKARWLREAARRTADLAVLHVIGPDVVSTVAFATSACPPVMIFEHSDHTFWIGSSVADMLLNSRTCSFRHTATRRFVPRNAILPIPLIDTPAAISKREARNALGIGADETVLLSIGRSEKYRPCGPFDFVATAGKILDRHPGAHLYVVGETMEGIAPYLRCRMHERLHFVGRIDGPSLYRTAADLYLESFPFGSLTALLEAALGELAVVPAYAPLAPMLVSNDDALDDLLTNPSDEADYVQRADTLLRHPEQRIMLGKALRERLLADHVDDGWRERLAAVYRQADRMTHCPRPIPVTGCCTTDADIGLSLWHAVACRRNGKPASLPWGKAAVLYHAAFVAKEAGDYAGARRFAWRAVRHTPLSRESWRLLLISMLGPRAGRIRSALLR